MSGPETGRPDPTEAQLTTAHRVGVVTALVSAAIHLRLGAGNLPDPLGVALALAGAGFVGGVVLVVTGVRRRLVSAVGVPFTLVQILAWYWVNFESGSKSFPADVGMLGAVDKLAQVALLGALLVILRGER